MWSYTFHISLTNFSYMKQKLPGIIFLLAMPCSVLLFVQVEKWSGSELVALFSAVLFYVVVAVILGFVFGRGGGNVNRR